MPGLAFSRPKKQFGLFLTASRLLKIYEVVGPFFKSIEFYILIANIFPFLKQSWAFFSNKHLATLIGGPSTLLLLLVYISHPDVSSGIPERQFITRDHVWRVASLIKKIMAIGKPDVWQLYARRGWPSICIYTGGEPRLICAF